MSICPHGLEAQQCSECCDAPTELRPPPEHEGKRFHWLETPDGPEPWEWTSKYWWNHLDKTEYVPSDLTQGCYCYLGPAEWKRESPSEMYIRLHRESHEREQQERIAALEAALDRANEVARQTQEIADMRAKRIAELEDDLRGEKSLTGAWQAWADARIAALGIEVASLENALKMKDKRNEHLRQMIYGHVINPPSDTPDFPATALAHSWATKGPR